MMDGGDIRANLVFDDAGNPLSTAPGNYADIVCDYGNFTVTVEVTLMAGSKQYEAEGESVARHLGEIKVKSGKDAYCFFVAPTIDPDAVVHFYTLHKENIRRYGGKSVIIPMTVEKFVSMLTQSKNCGYVPSPEKIRAFCEYSVVAANAAKDEEEWYAAIRIRPIIGYRSFVRFGVLRPKSLYKRRNQGSEFQGDCLIFTLFHGQNRISCEHGVNHWIPFTEEEVGAQDCFASHFMSDFLKGKCAGETPAPRQMELRTVFADGESACKYGAKFVISSEAKAVLDAVRELWRYYHAQPKANPNAAYYDIRKFFQGVKVDAKGKEKMSATSGDEGCNERLAALKAAMKGLGAKIQPKVYEYGFLKK